MELDLGIFTETKLVDGKHTTRSSGFEIIASKARNTHQGGVALFYRKSRRFHVEGTRSFGPNVIKTTLVSGKRRWKIIGVYIPPSETDGSTLDHMQAAANDGSNLDPLIILGDLNTDTKKETTTTTRTEYRERQIETLALLNSLGVEDLSKHFTQQKGRGDWTYQGRNNGRKTYARCDMIGTTDKSMFSSLQIKCPRFDSDHRMLKGTLKLDTEKEHNKYVKKRTHIPNNIMENEKTYVDELMDELTTLVKQPTHYEGEDDSRRASWISENTWAMMEMKAEARRVGDSHRAKFLGIQIRKGLKKDRKSRINTLAVLIENDLNLKEPEKAFGRIKGWYKEKPEHVPKPTPEQEKKTREEYQNLYARKEPPGTSIPIHVDPSDIDDTTPPEIEVWKALKAMRLGKSAGMTGIKVEHLRDWRIEWNKAEKGWESKPEKVEAWKKVLQIVDTIFRGELPPKSFGNGILVLIPKPVPDQYRGIALLETIYKLVSAIINNRLKEKIQFHDAVHGFRQARGTGTAIIRAKLHMQFAQRTTAPLYLCFMDLRKAYDTLNRQRTLEILKGYGVGKNVLKFIETIWDWDEMTPKQAGFYGKPFKASRGVRQGDVLSPMIFNLVVDAIIREAEHQRRETATNPNTETRDPASETIFYADDGLLIEKDSAKLQKGIDIYTELFGRVGLEMNTEKTVVMIMEGGKIKDPQSKAAYERRFGKGDGKTHRERMLTKTKCKLCGNKVNTQHLKLHQTRNICKKGRDEYATYLLENPKETEGETESESENDETTARTYCMEITADRAIKCPCPVPGCPASAEDGNRMRNHFRNKQVTETIIINQKSLPRCPKCGIFQGNALTTTHQKSLECQKWTKIYADRKQFAEKKDEAKTTTFTINKQKLQKVENFKYLGRVLTNKDSDDEAVEENMKKAKKKWGYIGKFLRREGADPKTMAIFYKTIIQAVLLYGAESWTISDKTMQDLRVFHHRCARSIARTPIRQDDDGNWVCPPTNTVLEKTGLFSIEEYILRRRTTVHEYISSTRLFKQCKESTTLASNPNQIVWWKQEI
jgi:Reverse transcriptase (RNA-dependent DNA polymerase)